MDLQCKYIYIDIYIDISIYIYIYTHTQRRPLLDLTLWLLHMSTFYKICWTETSRRGARQAGTGFMVYV